MSNGPQLLYDATANVKAETHQISFLLNHRPQTPLGGASLQRSADSELDLTKGNVGRKKRIGRRGGEGRKGKEILTFYKFLRICPNSLHIRRR